MKRTMIFILLSALMFTYAYAQEEEMTLEKIVVTSTRSTESIKNAPNDITVITEADIEMDKDKTIPDILREKAGIMVKEYSAGNAKQANIDIRGFGETGLSNVLVMVDGRRVTQIDLSGTDWAQIPLADVERIEVIRGAASVFYGDNASGGVINIITREGRRKPSLEITSETGSYSSYDNRLQYSGAYDNFNYYSLARHYESKGYRANNAIKTNDFDVKLGYKPLDAFKAKLSMGYHQDEYGLPGALNDAQINSLGRRASVKPFDNAKSMDYFGNLMLENDLEEKGKFITDISMRVR
ncbi:MAG: TonB-dependent receptor, partial [Deltaproteobacteria bacterium]